MRLRHLSARRLAGLVGVALLPAATVTPLVSSSGPDEVTATSPAAAATTARSGIPAATAAPDDHPARPGRGRSAPDRPLADHAPVTPSATTPSGSDQHEKTVYLTFDDGPHPTWTPRVLDTLDRHDAKATFFVVGTEASRYPGLVDRIRASGHGLGNHTAHHTDLTALDVSGLRAEVLPTQQLVGGSCLRAPYGRADARLQRWATAEGLHLVSWDVDPRDWTRPGARRIEQAVLRDVRPGSVVLLHDGGGNRSQTVTALERLLTQLEADGYRFAAMCR